MEAGRWSEETPVLSCGLGVTPAGVKCPPGSRGQRRASGCWGDRLSSRMATVLTSSGQGRQEVLPLGPLSVLSNGSATSSGLWGRQPSMVVTGYPHGYLLPAMELGANYFTSVCSVSSWVN